METAMRLTVAGERIVRMHLFEDTLAGVGRVHRSEPAGNRDIGAGNE